MFRLQLILDGLDEPARGRVLDWANARFAPLVHRITVRAGEPPALEENVPARSPAFAIGG